MTGSTYFSNEDKKNKKKNLEPEPIVIKSMMVDEECKIDEQPILQESKKNEENFVEEININIKGEFDFIVYRDHYYEYTEAVELTLLILKDFFNNSARQFNIQNVFETNGVEKKILFERQRAILISTEFKEFLSKFFRTIMSQDCMIGALDVICAYKSLLSLLIIITKLGVSLEDKHLSSLRTLTHKKLIEEDKVIKLERAMQEKREEKIIKRTGVRPSKNTEAC